MTDVTIVTGGTQVNVTGVTLPSFTTTGRDALTAATGMLIWNSTTGQTEEYNGTSWGAVPIAHTTDLDAHTYEPLSVLRTGEYYCFGRTGGYSTPALVANTLYAVPFIVTRPMTVDRIAIEVTTLADPSNIRLGIYNDGTNLYPGTLLLDAGVVSGATTGIKAITISQALARGIYWLALVSGATPSIRAINQLDDANASVLGVQAANFAYANSPWVVAFTYAALPDPFTAGGLITGTYDMPTIVLRLLSLD